MVKSKTTMKQEEITLKLAKEVAKLSKNIKHLEDNAKAFRIIGNPWKLMWFSLLKGLMIGFGSVLGATVVVAVFVYLLAQIEFVPILGEWVSQIIEQVGVGQ